MEIAHLSLRGRILIWKCIECGSRLEGRWEEEMKAVTSMPDFRPSAKQRFGWSIDLEKKENEMRGQTTL